MRQGPVQLQALRPASLMQGSTTVHVMLDMEHMYKQDIAHHFPAAAGDALHVRGAMASKQWATIARVL